MIKISLWLIILLVTPAFLWAEGAYPVNTVVQVQWGNPIFPTGYVDERGTAAPDGGVYTYRTGIFGLQYTSSQDPAAYLPFKAICIDASEDLFSGTQLYYVQTLASYSPGDGINPHNSSAPSLSEERKRLLQQLFSVAWADANLATPASPVNTAALQWAAWEIAGGTASNPGIIPAFSLGDGAVHTQLDSVVRSRADQYLNSINTSTPETALLIWSPVQPVDGVYQRMVGQEILSPVATPEPQYVAIPLLGMIALTLRLRKARR